MPAGRKTKVWAVHSKVGGSFLGWVAWFGAWRKYTFRPYDATVFDHKCLREIADFCYNQTAEHNRARKVSNEILAEETS